MVCKFFQRKIAKEIPKKNSGLDWTGLDQAIEKHLREKITSFTKKERVCLLPTLYVLSGVLFCCYLFSGYADDDLAFLFSVFLAVQEEE